MAVCKRRNFSYRYWAYEIWGCFSQHIAHLGYTSLPSTELLTSPKDLKCTYWRCTDKALADYRSADSRRLAGASASWYRLIKNVFCCVIKVIYLGSDCYPRTLTYLKNCRVQTKQKCTQKQSYKTHPLVPETEATLMFFILLVITIKTCTYQLCKWQSADTKVLVLSAR